jgi:hypothetical protein
MWETGLNLRLGTTELSMDDLTKQFQRLETSINEAMAIPEKDEWAQTTGYHCSSFVVHLYQRAGLFGTVLDIIPNEFHVRDVYQLDIFQKVTVPGSTVCETSTKAGVVPYCLIQGKGVPPLDGFSTITPYDHMNCKCGLKRTSLDEKC